VGAGAASDCVPFRTLRNDRNNDGIILRRGAKGDSPRHLAVQVDNHIYYGNLYIGTGGIQFNVEGVTHRLRSNQSSLLQ